MRDGAQVGRMDELEVGTLVIDTSLTVEIYKAPPLH